MLILLHLNHSTVLITLALLYPKLIHFNSNWPMIWPPFSPTMTTLKRQPNYQPIIRHSNARVNVESVMLNDY